MVDPEVAGRLVRQAWIDGVNKYFPGVPKQSYIAPWEEIGEWERAIVIEIFNQVEAFLQSGESSQQLSREQGGRLVRFIWIVQVYRRIPEPKASYVCSWEEMPEWEREADMDMFSAIEQKVLSPQ